MKIFKEICVILCISTITFFYFFWFLFANNEDQKIYTLTEKDKNISKIIAKKILDFSQKKNIPVEKIHKKLLFLLDKKKSSAHILAIVEESFKNISLQKQESNDFYKDYLLFPYYKDIYLSQKENNLIKRNIFRVNTEEKKVYLSFDDGPVTKKTLDYFKKNNIAASFFLICNRITKVNIWRYKNKLFSIWWHTLVHQIYDNMDYFSIKEDITKCREIFKENWLDFRLFRTAYGVVNISAVNILDDYWIKNYLWTIDSLDWNWWFTEEYAQKMAQKTQWGDVVLFHERVDLNVLDYYIKLLEKRGFSFWWL